MSDPLTPYILRDECALPSLTDEGLGVLPPGAIYSCDHHTWTVSWQRFRGGAPQPTWICASHITPTAEQIANGLQTPGRGRMIATGSAPVPLLLIGGTVDVEVPLSRQMTDASYFVELSRDTTTVGLASAFAQATITVVSRARDSVTVRVVMPALLSLSVGASIGVIVWS